MKLALNLAHLLHWLYKHTVSPIFFALGVRCRFHPTCSDYALEAVRAHGPIRGAWLGFSRVCRCHPWNEGGIDPCPIPRKRI